MSATEATARDVVATIGGTKRRACHYHCGNEYLPVKGSSTWVPSLVDPSVRICRECGDWEQSDGAQLIDRGLQLTGVQKPHWRFLIMAKIRRDSRMANYILGSEWNPNSLHLDSRRSEVRQARAEAQEGGP